VTSVTETSPVAFIIFNRPEVTRRVFEKIRAAKPSILLVVADGPRANKAGEAERCAEARAVISTVDWPCDVRTNYSDVNLGCGKRVSSGITWVFKNVERAVILEDDCDPHPSFFGYANELLNRYENDERVMHIGGVNFQNGQPRGNASYFFSHYPHVWGWATWRRAWSLYDFEMKTFDRFIEAGGLQSFLPDVTQQRFWHGNLKNVKEGKIDTWDFQWVYACWSNHALSIHPNVNLVTNLGFGADATHTPEISPLMNIPAVEIGKLRHPEWMTPDMAADRYTFEHAFDGNVPQQERAWPTRVRRNISRIKRRVLS